MYDAAAGQAERAEQLAAEILTACLDAGGSLTGEHGIGLDKACQMPRMFSAIDLDDDAAAAHRVRPGRSVQPRQGRSPPRACAARCPGPYRAHPLEREGVPRL